MYSLRRVLAVRFSLTMLVALTLIAFWASVGLRRAVRLQTDRLLTGGLGIAEAILAQGQRLPAQVESGTTGERGRVTRYIVVRDSSGTPIDANIARARRLPVDAASLARARSGETVWVTQRWGDDLVRSIYAPAPTGSQPGAVVQVASSTYQLANTNLDILIILAGTVLLGAIATAFGAFWLARSAVTPVLEVADQARAITPGSSGRITAHADVAEYASLVEVLNDVLERSQRAFNAQRRLVADVSHELKTPLTSLHGEFEIALRSERSPAEYRRVLESGVEEVDRLTALCDSLTLVTRVETGTLVPRLVPTDLGDVIQRSLDRVRPRLEEKGVQAAARLHYANGRVPADAALLERLLGNLLDNAISFTPAGGTVAVATERSANGERIAVEDTGPGIPADALPHLFEPFYRADEARTRSESTGLGLTVAASIARLHQGSIRAENRAEGGARLTLELPVPANAPS
jgi:signal transduction histidine kinase